jgi:phosphonatase-like hydrolase
LLPLAAGRWLEVAAALQLAQMARRVDLFVLDLAGTVVMDDDHVLRSFLAAGDAFGLDVDPAALQARMGWHKQRVFEDLLAGAGRSTAQAASMAARFEEEFAALVAREPLRPTPGAQEVLEALASGGVQVAFNTGFSRRTADVVLRAMALDDAPSVASDEVAAGRPAPDMLRAAMGAAGVEDPARVGCAGDTPADLAAGAAAGLAFVVGVGCGTHSLEQLRGHAHTHLLMDLRPLPQLLLRDG